MSEQTPNSSEDLSGAEPSMEDILASIRKIISDDEPVAMESPEDIPVVSLVDADSAEPLDDLMQGIHMDSNDLTSDAVLDEAVLQTPVPSPAAESVDLNIDDVLAGLDEEVLNYESSAASAVGTVADVAETEVPVRYDVDAESDITEGLNINSLLPGADIIESHDNALKAGDEDILALLDTAIPLSSEPIVSEPVVEVSQSDAVYEALQTPEPIPEAVNFDDDEMDALLDDILLTPVEADDTHEDMPIETGFSTEPSAVEENSDLDLVKSLMADLADDQGDLESEEDLDALLAIPDVEDEVEVEALAEVETTEVDAEAVTEAPPEPEEDILGDILDMTLEDELQSHPEDAGAAQDEHLESLDAVIEAEQQNVAENIQLDEDDLDDDLPSLSEIAAAAEADAVAAETARAPQAVAATAGLGAIAGLAALGATSLSDTPAEAETAETNFEPETSPEPIPTEETSMPVQAVKTDAILDDVTETAAAGAFAELNQVVEDKAIFNERGPRIGDLVQEALRPMLKEWLDANLKGIVERAVAKEVKRISSGK